MGDPRQEGTITYEATEWGQTHTLENFYLLKTSLAPFGFLYVGKHVCTLGWQGRLVFSQLDTEALVKLPSLITNKKVHITPKNPDRGEGEDISVAFILEKQNVVEYNLSEEASYRKYQKITRSGSDHISFARYDIGDVEGLVQGTPPHTFTYGFTAENPRWSERGQLTILLPKGVPWEEDLLNWAIKHHKAVNVLQNRIDLRAFRAVLASLSRR